MKDFGICKRCNERRAVFMVLLEGDEDWTKSYAREMCEECTNEMRAQVIDTWTEKEWDD